METVATVNVVIFLIVYGIAVFIGIDPKKWQTWLLSLYGFLTYFLAGIVGTGKQRKFKNKYCAGESGLCYLHLRFDRKAEGCNDRPSICSQLPGFPDQDGRG